MSHTELGQKLSSVLYVKKTVGHLSYSQMEKESGVPRSVIERFMSGTAEISGYYVFRLMEYAQVDLQILTSCDCPSEAQIDCLMHGVGHAEWLSRFSPEQRSNFCYYLLKAVEALGSDCDELRKESETESPPDFLGLALRMENINPLFHQVVLQLSRLAEGILEVSDALERKDRRFDGAAVTC